MSQKIGFGNKVKASTLIKLLLINGVVSIVLAAIVVAVNPAKMIAQTNNTKRNTSLISILNAIYAYSADNKGAMPDKIPKPGQSGKISSTDIDLCSALVPQYLPSLPADPTAQNNGNVIKCTEAYDTEFTLSLNEAGTRITVSAPNTQLPLTSPISISR